VLSALHGSQLQSRLFFIGRFIHRLWGAGHTLHLPTTLFCGLHHHEPRPR
jgi:hypothetical protein